MTQSTEFWVEREQLRNVRLVTRELAGASAGEVIVAIDRFAVTANNVTYAVYGHSIGYWDFYPAEGEWGKVPVWGCGTVISSCCEEVPVGERLWGFFPMASHARLTPGKVREDQFADMAAHRQGLPTLYNQYRRTRAEPAFLQARENERCLYFPLFVTSFLLADYLVDNNCFGSEQVLIGSASSKTGFGLAHMLHHHADVSATLIGLTSAGNRAFVQGLDCCDEVVVYGDEGRLDASRKTTFVDMSGDSRLTRALHYLLGDNMLASIMVGATHWEQGAATVELPGAQPAFFFAPDQIAKRDKEWGPGVLMQKAGQASAGVARAIASEVSLEWATDGAGLAALWQDLLDNRITPDRGLMISLL